MNEQYKCGLCGSTDHKIYLPHIYAHQGMDYDLVRCQNCGLVFVHPFPDFKTIAGFYGEKYFKSDFGCGMYDKSYLETDSTRVEEYREMLGMIETYKKSGRLLEVGCAAGSFLYYAKRAGFEVSGVDISDWAVDTAKTQFGLDVKKGRLQDLQLPAENFDVVFLSDLLEHEPEPIQFLAEIKRILKTDGIAALKVPVYVNSFYYHLVRRLPWSWTLGKLDEKLLQALKVSSSGPKFPPYHLYEYSRKTLALLLEKCGFQIIDQKSSLIVPEFLETQRPGFTARLIWLGFITLRFMIKKLNIHGGHAIVFARKA